MTVETFDARQLLAALEEDAVPLDLESSNLEDLSADELRVLFQKVLEQLKAKEKGTPLKPSHRSPDCCRTRGSARRIQRCSSL